MFLFVIAEFHIFVLQAHMRKIALQVSDSEKPVEVGIIKHKQ